MRKRFEVKVYDINSAEDTAVPGKVTIDTDEKTVDILTQFDQIVMSFDTLNQITTQIEDMKNYDKET